MKLLLRLHISYYLCLLLFILAIPHQSTDANIFKLILFLLTIGVFIFLCTFYIVLSFNKKIRAVRKYSNMNVGIMCCGIILFLTFGHVIYTKWNIMLLPISLFIILFVASNLLNYKIVEELQFDLMKEVKLFYKMGQALDETPINNAVSRLDYMFYAFCIAVFIAEDIFIFVGVVGVILILSTKYLRALKTEFLKSGFITVRETNLSLGGYYFFYLLSIIWTIFVELLKKYMRKREEVYDDKK